MSLTDSIITSKSKGFKLGRGGISAPLSKSRPNSTNLLNTLVPLQDQLNFKTKAISGNDYKAIVDRALQKSTNPSTTSTLVNMEADAINRIKQEQDAVNSRNRSVALYQATAKFPGSSSSDHAGMYNFWIDQANQAAQSGDELYYAQALSKAADERQAYSRAGAADSKKISKAEATKFNNDVSKTQQDLKDTLTYLQQEYQSGKIDGNTFDAKEAVAYSIASQGDATHIGLQKALDTLIQAKANGIDTIGSKDIDSAIAAMSGQLNGIAQDDGTVKGGLYNQISSITNRIQNPGTYKDVLTFDKSGKPTLSRVFDDGSKSYIQQENGWWLPVTSNASSVGTGNPVTYRVQTIGPEGKVVTRYSQPTTSTDTPVFLNDLKQPIVESQGRISVATGTPSSVATGHNQDLLHNVLGNVTKTLANVGKGALDFGLKNLTLKGLSPATNNSVGVTAQSPKLPMLNSQISSLPKMGGSASFAPALTYSGASKVNMPPITLPSSAKITPQGTINNAPSINQNVLQGLSLNPAPPAPTLYGPANPSTGKIGGTTPLPVTVAPLKVQIPPLEKISNKTFTA